MMKFDFIPLEFETFRSQVVSHFLSTFAVSHFNSLNILNTKDAIYTRQREISEAVEIAESQKVIEDDSEFYNLYHTLNDNTKSFNPIDFIIIRNFFNRLQSIYYLIISKKYKSLELYVNSFNSYADITALITSSIDDKGNIKDDATERLKEIRYLLNEHRKKITKLLSGIFNSKNADKFIQDKVVVLRNGRYTIPCKTNFSQYIQGIIQDKSISGQTLYIEPADCVNENNNMLELIIEESEEIAKVIYTLISAVKSILDDLQITINQYSYLSMILELGCFYADKDFTFGEVSNSILLKSVHHPLLYLKDNTPSIPIDFVVNSLGDQVVITGPNTGGKTAAIKSIGLNHIISLYGLAVFGKTFKFIMFDNIVADIGDNQSIVMDLSTFSAHILNIKEIVENVSSNSLVLLDELGTGTEPREGASLAVAVLKYLREKNATVIVTTHFTEVKNYALNKDYTYFYAVDFDYDSLAPRYILLKNIMGKSDPIMIAKRLGFKKEIIDMAEDEISHYKSLVEVKVEDLNRMIAENEHMRQSLLQKEQELSQKEEALRIQNKELEKKLNSKELELLEESYSLLQKSKRLAMEKMKAKKEHLDDMIKETAKKISKIKDSRENIKDIKANDIIFLEQYSKTAKILDISGDSVSLNMEGLRIKLKKKDIVGHKVEQVKKQNIKISNNTSKSRIKREILLVGMRVEEALGCLEKFMDDSILANYDKVYIIHGRGTGQLRKAVHEYLRTHNKVINYYLADNSEGGNAVTIAEF